MPRRRTLAVPRGLRILPATAALCEALAGSLRPTDAAEAIAVHGDAALAVHASLAASAVAWIALDEISPICGWGVGNRTLLGGIGIPWCLTTARVELYRRPFAVLSKAWVEAMRLRYDRLENWVDPRHERAVRWLGWLGFAIGPALDHPAFRSPMRPFWMDC